MKSRLFIICWKAVALIGLILTVSCSNFSFRQEEASSVAAEREVTSLPEPAGSTVPHPDHVLLVIEENHSYSEIIGSSSTPYINSLASQGATLTNSYAITHPSEPNYLALFAGSTFGLSDDSCPHTLTSANLAQELIKARGSFGGYSEDLPSIGYTGCSISNYARKHNPWVNFTNVPSSLNMPLSNFPTNPVKYRLLPTISIVIPNLQDDMHDGTIKQGDTWLRDHIDSYVRWAKANNSLLVITWDEDDNSNANQIPTLFLGPMVKPGKYGKQINHYNVLRTLEMMYNLAPLGESTTSTPIRDIWQTVPSSVQTP